MTAKAKVKPVQIEAWGGFVEGKLYITPSHVFNSRLGHVPYGEPRYAIFDTRKSARQAYQDVRRVTVTVTPAKRGKSK